ncbi:sialic acid-binding Ig-like lectin 13 [Rhinatrema bivittatum]|uniref:sialic acid-binding Ig-like lectin 13 n=1 Tax=Rhinatrema bivittatum TaxID=194408 RepID=UPI00112B7692|nr:sialic acid-binding Ig-like lectin 13 [Rhinatrema bivittatum]
MQRAGLLLMSLVVWEGFLYQVTPIEFYMNSSDSVTVQQGLCVVIPCKFGFPSTVILGDNPHGYWFREADIPGINKPVATNDGSREVSENTRNRFQLVGDLKKQDCTLRINDAKEEDIGRYFFRIEGGFLYSFFNKIRPFVNVTDLSEQPKVSHAAMLAARVPVNVACTAPGRCAGTAPIITWTGTLNRAYSTTNISSANRNGTVTHTSKITFIPSVRDYNKTLTCLVYYPAVKASTQITVSLNVEYRPESEGWPESGDWLESNCTEKHEGISCTCWIRSNPPPLLLWLINEEIVTGNYSNHTLQVLSGAHGHTANSTLTFQGGKARTLNIQCRNANKLSNFKKLYKQLDSEIVTWIIYGNVIIISLTALASFYCGRKIKAREKGASDFVFWSSLSCDISKV